MHLPAATVPVLPPTVAEPTPADLLPSLASYVAQAVLRRIATTPRTTHTPQGQRVPAAVLFADISGFTRLTDQLTRGEPQGVERLSALLNTYFDGLLSLVRAHGGDVAAFTGDGFIAIWETPSDATLPVALQAAAQCSLAIQRGFAHYPITDQHAQFVLTLRVALSAGELLLARVGGVLGRWEVLFAGDPIREVGIVETQTQPGDVVVAAAAQPLLAPHAVLRDVPGRGVLLTGLHQSPPPTPLPAVPLSPAMVPALSALLPGIILDRLESGLSDWLAELRQVTVLFINVVGIDDRAPAALDQLQQITRAIQTGVYQYEGSVNQFVLDDKGFTVVAAMGLPPLTHPDDALRGVQAAMTVQAHLRRLAPHVSSTVGIASGRVFCGARGNQWRRDYAMIGSVVNLAARLMQAAQQLDPGDTPAILCDAATVHLTEQRLRYSPAQTVPVKGKPEPVPVYRPVGRVQNLLPAPATPVVGREAEQQTLHIALHTLVAHDVGRVVLLRGEHGMGKSRLLVDLLQTARNAGITVLPVTADPVMQTRAYAAWQAVFFRLFGLDDLPDDVSDNVIERRIRVLNRLWVYPDLAPLAPLLNAVLPLGLPDNDTTRHLRGHIRADSTRRLLHDTLVRFAAQQPLVIIFDEAHTLDAASWHLLLALARSRAPVLQVVAMRPLVAADVPALRELQQLPDVVLLDLAPLSAAAVIDLLQAQIGGATLAPDVAALVVEWGDGNPLHSEELLLALRDAGMLVSDDGVCRFKPEARLHDTSIPASLQGVLISRIDRLPPSSQLTLKVASVLGQSFTPAALHAIDPVGSSERQIGLHLSALVRLNLLHVVTDEPSPTYTFHHELLRETAYNLLLFAQRRSLHAAAARWYRRDQTTPANPLHSILAYHWYYAGYPALALAHLEQAAAMAREAYADQEAVQLLRAMLQIADEHHNGEPPPTIAPLRRARWLRWLGEALYRLGDLDESAAVFAQALAVLGHPLPASRSRLVQATVCQTVVQAALLVVSPASCSSSAPLAPHQREAASSSEALIPIYYVRGETLALLYVALFAANQTAGAAASPELARATANLAVATTGLALAPLATRYTRRALAIADRSGHPDTRAYVHNLLGLAHLGAGRWARARPHLEEALDIYDHLNDRQNWGVAWTMLAQLAYLEADFGRTVEMMRFLTADPHTSGLQQGWAYSISGAALTRMGDMSAAHVALQQAEAALATTSDLSIRIANAGMQATWHLAANNLPAAQASAATVRRLLQGVDLPAAYYLYEGYAGAAAVGVATYAAERTNTQLAAARAACLELVRFAVRYPFARPRAAWCVGHVHWLAGHPCRALRIWQRGLKVARQHAMPYDEGVLLAALAQASPARSPERARYRRHATHTLARVAARNEVNALAGLPR